MATAKVGLTCRTCQRPLSVLQAVEVNGTLHCKPCAKRVKYAAKGKAFDEAVKPTVREWLGQMTDPDEVCAAEYRCIHDLLQSFSEEGLTPDMSDTEQAEAIDGILEEFEATAQKLRRQLRLRLPATPLVQVLPYHRLTLKKKDGEYTVRVTDAKNKTVASYFTTDKDDANATADDMIKRHSKTANIIDTRDRSN